MKIRKNFVSNSSSCSFSCVISKKDYLDALSSLTKAEQEIILQGGPPLESKTHLGTDPFNVVLVVGQLRDDPSLNDYYYWNHNDANECNVRDVLYNFVEAMKKFNVIYHEEER